MRLAILIAMAATATGLRSVVLVRHGISEMNVALARRPWGSPGFADPDIRDAPLTPEGLAGAERLRGTIGDVGAVDLVVSSPLTRALQTSAAVFRDAGVPAVATPLAAERCYLSSDVGAPVDALRRAWPRVAFAEDDFPEPYWWYGGGPAYAPPPADDWRPPGRYAAAGEPVADFRARLAKLVAWLEARDERSIALTCHWGVIAALTGESFENCEARRLPLSALRVREDVAY